jgi:glutamate-1-semialdehyde 2,1-aminomutase
MSATSNFFNRESGTVSVDPARLASLIESEEAEFNARHGKSRAMTERAERSLPGGVVSSWQATDPHPVYLAEGHGSKVTDVDGNEYVDFHNGYGAVAVGHAHPKIVEAVSQRIAQGSHFAQPTEDAIVVAEHLQQRFGQPLWRFGNSGTEETLDAVRLMRAVTGRDIILKIEGSYHGHHDALMVSVSPPGDSIGSYEDPVSVPQTIGLPADYVNLTKVVPFNDLDALERTLERYKGQVAGMIVEPAMMNAGFVLPEDGYLQGVKDLLHQHGALLTFDEVKTGATIAYGGATEAFGVTPDIICLAKSVGGGLPCGAIGGTEEVMSWIADGRIDQVGTFNGNPLTMAAMRATLIEILVPDAYTEFNRLADILRDGCDGVMERSGIAGYTTAMAARGAVTYRGERVRNYRDYLEVSDDLAYVNWLVQFNRGVFMAPWGKSENWTLTVQHSEGDVRRYIDNFDFLGKALSA